MKVKIKKITPRIAESLLKKNTSNRPLSIPHVNFLAKAMLRGEWKLNGDAIRYNSDQLIDGQHRLAAVVESGISIESVVCEDVEGDVFDTVDTGKLRSASDILAINGIKQSCTIAAALRVIHHLMSGRRERLTNIQYVEMFEHYADTQNSTHIAGRCKKAGILSGSIACATHCLFSRIDQDKADSFFEALVTGVGLEIGSPVLALRDRLLREKNSYTKLHSRQISYLVVKAWNGYYSGEKACHLKVSSTRPRISGLDYSEVDDGTQTAAA